MLLLVFLFHSKRHSQCPFPPPSFISAVKITFRILILTECSSSLQLVQVFWSCYFMSLLSTRIGFARVVHKSSYIHTSCSMNTINKERYYFNSPIRAQAGIIAILSRNFRRKFPYFERKSGYQMPVYNTGLFPKKENIRIFHESWIFLPFINIDTLFLMYIFCLKLLNDKSLT